MSRDRLGIPCRFPNCRQNAEHFVALAQLPPHSPLLVVFQDEAIQQTDRIFPVVARVQTEFVQDRLFQLATRFLIALINRTEIFPFRLVTHSNPLQNVIRVGLHFKWRDTDHCILRRSAVCCWPVRERNANYSKNRYTRACGDSRRSRCSTCRGLRVNRRDSSVRAHSKESIILTPPSVCRHSDSWFSFHI